MNKSLLIHNAARKYCIERFAFWAKRYSKVCQEGRDRKKDRYHYTDEALDTFPRYNVVNAIRIELERLDADALPDYAETKSLILLAGQIGEDMFTQKPSGVVDASAMANERQLFCDFVDRFEPSASGAVPILPYRRVLSDAESKSIWAMLRDRWRIDGCYWYPLRESDCPDVQAYNSTSFRDAICKKEFQSILKSRDIQRVWELREYGPEYLIDVDLFEGDYNGAEGFWTSKALDWIVYASHESSITVGGTLLPAIRSIWPESQNHIWAYPV